MSNNKDIIKEITRVYTDLLKHNLRVVNKVSARDVPYLVINETISICFFWKSKAWKVFPHGTGNNNVITEKRPIDLVPYVLKYFEKELSFEVIK